MSKQSNDNKYDFKVKLLVLGDGSVGKTSLLVRYCDNQFSQNHTQTLGVEFKMKHIEIDDKIARLFIYDTAGQEKYRSIVNSFYKGANGIVLVYSCDDRPSYDNVENWMKQIKQNSDDGTCVILVGNKKDITERSVASDEGRQLAEKYQIKFFETSAKLDDDKSVYDAFYSLTKEIKDKLPPEIDDIEDNPKNTKEMRKITLVNDNKSITKQTKCC